MTQKQEAVKENIDTFDYVRIKYVLHGKKYHKQNQTKNKLGENIGKITQIKH